MLYSVITSTNADEVSRKIRSDVVKHPVILSKALSRLAYLAKEDSKDSMVKELDRPKPFTQNAIQYQKANTRTLTSAIFVNKKNTYLQFMVYGGVRRKSRGRVLVPGKNLRNDRYGQLSRAKRRRILKSPKTFRVEKNGQSYLMRRIGKRTEFVASLEKQTKYKTTGYWKFHDAGLRSYDKRFNKLIIAEHRKYIK